MIIKKILNGWMELAANFNRVACLVVVVKYVPFDLSHFSLHNKWLDGVGEEKTIRIMTILTVLGF